MNLRKLLGREEPATPATEPIRQSQVMRLLRVMMAERDVDEAVDHHDDGHVSEEYKRAKARLEAAKRASTREEIRAAYKALERGDEWVLRQLEQDEYQRRAEASGKGKAQHRETCGCGKDGSHEAHGLEHKIRGVTGILRTSLRPEAHEDRIEARQLDCKDIQDIRERVARDYTWDQKSLWQKLTALVTGRANEYTAEAYDRVFISDRSQLTERQQKYWAEQDARMEAARQAAQERQSNAQHQQHARQREVAG